MNYIDRYRLNFVVLLEDHSEVDYTYQKTIGICDWVSIRVIDANYFHSTGVASRFMFIRAWK